MPRMKKADRIERAHVYAEKYAQALLREAEADSAGLVLLFDAWEAMEPMDDGYVNHGHEIVVTVAGKLAWHARTHQHIADDDEDND